jgi:hypothetical protein
MKLSEIQYDAIEMIERGFDNQMIELFTGLSRTDIAELRERVGLEELA